MAYAAMISLRRTIQDLVNSYHNSIEILEFAYDEVVSLQVFLRKRENSSSNIWNALVTEIKDVVFELEYLIQSEGDGWRPWEAQLEEVKQTIFLCAKNVKEEYLIESGIKESPHDALPSTTVFVGNKSRMVGLSDQVSKIIAMLTEWKLYQLLFVSLLGMPGIGKTALANEIFEHPSILKRFHCRVWLTLGPNYRSENILQDILAQTDSEIDQKGDEILALSKFLRLNRCLIVLDGVWNTEVLNFVERLSQNIMDGSGFLVTTTLERVAVFTKTYRVHQMRLLNKQESWCLLRDKVFGEDHLCPPQLEKAGKKIAENCEGLPLTIVTVGDHLSRVEKSPDYWRKVAEKKNSVFMDAYDKISEVLIPSYDYLSEHLKILFLYMGVFPEKHEIPHSRLINLWIAEGFLEHSRFKTSEHFGAECLKDLVSTSVVMVCKQSTSNRIKTCSLHSAFLHLCIKEATKKKFFHIVKFYSSAEDMESQNRLCIHKNALLGMKSLNNLMASNSIMSSLLCTGEHHQYPVPICLNSRFLRVLDALTLRFYTFPLQALKLVELRYFALTYDGKLPSSISQLRNLQYLVVYPYIGIKYAEKPQYLPMEIWDMQELKHLQIIGSELLANPCGTLLQNLLALYVGSHSCTEKVLKSTPNLKKLGIRIELSPDLIEPLSCFDHVSHLSKLETLKCVIVNPIFKSEVVAPPPPISTFPSNLKKLSLSGLGYPWEDMGKIALLPNLEVLKLRFYAFRGSKWEIQDDTFMKLEFLLIEESDLVQCTAGKGSLPFLHSLSIKHCYKLQEMPRKFALSLGMIQVVDCKPIIVNWAKKLEKFIDVRIRSSWDDKDLKK